MKTGLCTKGGGLRTGIAWVLAGLLLVAFDRGASAAGGGTGTGAGTSPGLNNSGPEDCGSLPVVNDSYGLTFVGRLRELRALAISLRGRGRIDAVRLGGGLVGVTLVGDYDVELDRAALANSSVAMAFRGGVTFQNGVAFLQIGGSSPVRFDADRVPLPVARLAATRRAQGSLLRLDVLTRMHSANVTASFALDRVTLTQRIL